MVNIKWLNQKNKKGYMGVSFTDKHTSIVVVRHQEDAKPKIEYAAVSQLTLRNVPGLKSLVSRDALKSFPCNAALNVEQYQILQVDKPNLPEAEIKPALKWKVKELLDYQVEKGSVDGVDIPADPANPNRLPFMFAVCAKNSCLGEVSNALLDAGIKLKSIDVQAFTQRNIASLLEFEDRVLVMVTLLERGCLITFTARGELYQTRFVELDKGFMLDQHGELFASNLEKLTLELQRSLDSFDRQFPFLSIQRMLISPDVATSRLVEGLKASLYLPVETFDLKDIVDFSEVEDFSSYEKQAMLLPALGAALRVEENA